MLARVLKSESCPVGPDTATDATVDALRLEINQQTPQLLIKSISLETLVNH
jgi:hypothetical protein